MLYVYIGRTSNSLCSPGVLLNQVCDMSWFDDQFVKNMIKDVDSTEVISGRNMYSPILGSMNYTYLSGGVQTLILMYKTDYIMRGSNCGDNCAKWFLEIGKRKDCIVTLGYCMDFQGDFEITLLNDGSVVHNAEEFILKFLKLNNDDYCEHLITNEQVKELYYERFGNH